MQYCAKHWRDGNSCRIESKTSININIACQTCQYSIWWIIVNSVVKKKNPRFWVYWKIHVYISYKPAKNIYNANGYHTNHLWFIKYNIAKLYNLNEENTQRKLKNNKMQIENYDYRLLET